MGTFSYHPLGNDHALDVQDGFFKHLFKSKEFDIENSEEIRKTLLGVSINDIDEYVNSDEVDSYYHYVIPYTFEEYQAFEVSDEIKDKLKELLKSSIDTYFGQPISKDHYDSLIWKTHYKTDLYYLQFHIEIFLKYFDEIFAKKFSLDEAIGVNEERNNEKSDEYEFVPASKMICPHCHQEFEAGEETACPICGKEIAQEYFDFDMLKEMLIHNYSCGINLFRNEEEFLKWVEVPLKRTGPNQYSVYGLTYKYNENGEIIDLLYDFDSDNDPSFLSQLLDGDMLYETGFISGYDYEIYKIFFDKLKDIKGDDVIYRIRNRGLWYYAMFDGSFRSPFYSDHINAIPVHRVSKNPSREEIIKALEDMGMYKGELCYETNLWGDFFFDAPKDEIIDTMSYFIDENIVR